MKIVFMGEKPFSAKCLKYLLKQECKIVGIATRKETDVWWGKQVVREIADENKIPIIKRRDIKDLKPDILLSALYPFLIERDLIESVDSAYNVHLAPLPEYKGCNCGSHALMNGDTRYGVTIHEMTPELDNGRVIDRQYFDLTLEDTAKTLYEKGCNLGYKMFKENILNILSGGIKFQEYYDNGSEPTPRDSLENKQIPNTKDRRGVYNFVRALDFSPFEPAFFLGGKEKIHLKAKDFELENFRLRNQEKEKQLKNYLINRN
jgi:methionyl-tRNA formyltransferase